MSRFKLRKKKNSPNSFQSSMENSTANQLPASQKKAPTRKYRPSLRKRTMRNPAKKNSAFDQLFSGLMGNTANTDKYTNYTTTYGEVTEQGIRKMSETFQKYCPLKGVPIENRTFFDLGCGVGKAVIGMAILHPELRSCGIEIVEERIQFARQAQSRIKNKNIMNRVAFYEGSFLDPKYRYTSTCWLYMSNLCFNEETQQQLLSKFAAELPQHAVVICSKELNGADKKGFVLKERINIPMTWNEQHVVNIYQKV
jgi:tRNA G46 methylase TrmB